MTEIPINAKETLNSSNCQLKIVKRLYINKDDLGCNLIVLLIRLIICRCVMCYYDVTDVLDTECSEALKL